MPDGDVAETGDPIRGHEAIAERPDGSRVNFIPYPTPLRDGQGKLVGAINMLVDITDRRKRKRLYAASESLRNSLKTPPKPSTGSALTARSCGRTKQSYACLGYSAEEYVGRNIASFTGSRSDSGYPRRLHAARRSKSIALKCAARMARFVMC